ncbi:SDR family oxidoreductase [Photobacterium sp. OFAV2-7]|uniref:UDP-glucose 4-epimerase family protein n=1 Tax=Photobacterium sp. OFAV2-7 TaxID=2917748 RepID=UPI001EF6562A|nr:SDR family oxidoreductase [Photobacterium sp. OFAV2-7]MCG7587626.1 SDR family oxidoreductase [Photobacterium sp. OFAV2-7]
MNVLITGSNGFVGRHLSKCLINSSYDVVDAGRTQPKTKNNFLLLDLDSNFDITSELASIDVVVHCAARVHVMDDNAKDPLVEYRRINKDATLTLAQQAAKAGVKRFVFLSTIKVNGEYTNEGNPFTPQVSSPPLDPYGLSKYEAEQGLIVIAKETGMEVVIIRPPLVYGPGVKANFAAMMNLVSKGLPLPMGSINNSRSLVYIGNLTDLIVTCLSHPKAANQVFLVSDDQDVSTSDLLRLMAKAMNKPCRLLPIPEKWLRSLTTLIGKPGIGERLCGSLQVDISQTKTCLGWQPPYTLGDALNRTVNKAP